VEAEPLIVDRRAHISRIAVSDQYHVAYPKLYGAPAYARPPRPALPDQRPLDPDDMPLEAERTPEEQVLLAGGTEPQAVPAEPRPGARSEGGVIGAALRAFGLDR
jgi:hypothetical protein